jgi:hypothetical protein
MLRSRDILRCPCTLRSPCMLRSRDILRCPRMLRSRGTPDSPCTLCIAGT